MQEIGMKCNMSKTLISPFAGFLNNYRNQLKRNVVFIDFKH